jgi:hypothetical protein
MTVTFENIRIDASSVRLAIFTRSAQVFMAHDVARWLGFRNFDSNHGAYRPILRALNKLYENGEIGKYFVMQANVSIFYRIP